MKYIKLYEDLIKDLSGLGLTDDRCLIKLTVKDKRSDLEMDMLIIFPTLNREGKITKEDVAKAMKEGEYEISFLGKDKSEYFITTSRKELDQFIEKESMWGGDSRLIRKTLRYLVGWYALPTVGELIIDGEVIDSANNTIKTLKY